MSKACSDYLSFSNQRGSLQLINKNSSDFPSCYHSNLHWELLSKPYIREHLISPSMEGTVDIEANILVAV